MLRFCWSHSRGGGNLSGQITAANIIHSTNTQIAHRMHIVCKQQSNSVHTLESSIATKLKYWMIPFACAKSIFWHMNWVRLDHSMTPVGPLASCIYRCDCIVVGVDIRGSTNTLCWCGKTGMHDAFPLAINAITVDWIERIASLFIRKCTITLIRANVLTECSELCGVECSHTFRQFFSLTCRRIVRLIFTEQILASKELRALRTNMNIDVEDFCVIRYMKCSPSGSAIEVNTWGIFYSTDWFVFHRETLLQPAGKGIRNINCCECFVTFSTSKSIRRKTGCQKCVSSKLMSLYVMHTMYVGSKFSRMANVYGHKISSAITYDALVFLVLLWCIFRLKNSYLDSACKFLIWNKFSGRNIFNYLSAIEAISSENNISLGHWWNSWPLMGIRPRNQFWGEISRFF